MNILDRADQSDEQRVYVAALERENALLREVLWEQWEYNHSEHCDRDWPHPHGARCHWPLPELLGSH
jgi:hypothetical protein